MSETAKYELVAENDFSKTFKCGDTELFVAKAFDGVTKKDFLVFSIPFIEELNVSKIQYPVAFKSEIERDAHFASFDADKFMADLTRVIRENNEKVKKQ